MSLGQDRKRGDLANFNPKHFLWSVEGKVATITFNRPERKNPFTFDSYAELRDIFFELNYCHDIKAVVITGAGGNFCSGGDVKDIIGPMMKLQEERDIVKLLDFARMTGDVVKAMRNCSQIIISAVDGICVGAGAIVAMASDLRYGTLQSKVGFLFIRAGVSAADMGACNILPRIIGVGRAAELFYTGRMMEGEEAERWGFYNKLCSPETLLADAQKMAVTIASGPTIAHAMTKRAIHQEWSMGIDEAIEAEAQAQTIVHFSHDFKRSYLAFIDKQKPNFEGN